jgi:hypothetical protein
MTDTFIASIILPGSRGIESVSALADKTDRGVIASIR